MPTTTNVACQPYEVPNHAIKGGAVMAPIAAPLLKIPEAVERSSGGNHSLVNFMAAGQFPASPTPNKNLQTPNWNGRVASAWSIAAVVQKAMHNEYPRRVPNLSIKNPETPLEIMYATKKAVAI